MNIDFVAGFYRIIIFIILYIYRNNEIIVIVLIDYNNTKRMVVISWANHFENALFADILLGLWLKYDLISKMISL